MLLLLTIVVVVLCLFGSPMLLLGSFLPPNEIVEERVAAPTPYSVFYEQGNWVVRPGTGGIAVATYDVQQTTNGWDYLKITTDETQSNYFQAYAAGFIEGTLTYESIFNSWNSESPDIPTSTDVEDFVLAQDSWVRDQVKSQESTSDYWAQVGLVMAQFDGLIAGYALSAEPQEKLSYTQMLYLQMNNELDDILTYTELLKTKKNTLKQESSLHQHYKMGTHCSALIKISSDGQRLYAAHNTWSSYTSMLRTYKTYELNYNLSNYVPLISFSSYPATLSSSDDFYITSAQLVVMETTNDVMNDSLYLDYMSNTTVPEWIRAVVANRIALNGNQWSTTFSLYNSGTYNNQWQIVDYKLFTPAAPLQPGTLFILEQIPGFVVYQDMTQFLSSDKFWPSYNIPYFPEIFNLSNYPAYEEKYGNVYSYQNCARAQIFRRDAPSVEVLTDMQRIMRYNEYQTDPLSLQDACRGISARCDLNPPWNNNTLNPYSPFGAIDCKITSNSLVPTLQASVVAGPTWDSQPPFAWTGQWDNPHYGQAEVFDFQFAVTP